MATSKSKIAGLGLSRILKQSNTPALFQMAICITSLSQDQVAIASYAFQIFCLYEQILRVKL